MSNIFLTIKPNINKRISMREEVADLKHQWDVLVGRVKPKKMTTDC
jgi:hypothetical protein